MTPVKRLFRPLTERDQPGGRIAIQADERFGPDEVTSWAEQRMATLHRTKNNGSDLIKGAAKHRGIDQLNAAAVDPEPALADNQGYCHGIKAEDEWPFLRDHVEQTLQAAGFECSKDGRMDRRHGARVSPGEGDQVLVGLFRRRNSGSQSSQRMVLEGNHPGHCRRMSQPKVNIQWRFRRSSVRSTASP